MNLFTPHYWKASKNKLFKKDLYFVKTPWWLKKLYPNCVWDIKTTEKKIYLTFDDGPHPTITPFVLEELKKYNAKATFFCIGDNVKKYPETFGQIIKEGHSLGNHTMHHINGWKTNEDDYLKDVNDAAVLINSILFRPPYGRINKAQVNRLQKDYKVIMWNILAGDWDENLTPEKCFNQVKSKIYSGAIIVFHDSEKANNRLCYALPKLLKFCTDEGYVFEKISWESS